jgi:phytoene dehydrogenase-like protein
MSTKPVRAREVCRNSYYDAVVVGSGPNGIACAIAVAQTGRKVLVVEGQPQPGGGCRSAELTLPGFIHDICSAVYPLGYGSPFFRTLPLETHGLRWINPDGCYVHAFAPGKPLVIERDLNATARNLGPYGDSFADLIAGLLPTWDDFCEVLLNPPELLLHPLSMARFGTRALLSAKKLANRYLVGDECKAAFAGVAAHSSLPLTAPASASIALALAIAAHAVGWPIPEGGAQSLIDSLINHFTSLGGELITGAPVKSLADLPSCNLLFFDVTPVQFVRIAGNALPSSYVERVQKFRYGPGVFKMDWALSSPIPWSSPDFLHASTVHIGGTLTEIAESELAVAQGRVSLRPYVLLVQPSVFDASRAPNGAHTVWAYCHVPPGDNTDISELVEAQIERFAPGFKKLVLASSSITPSGFHQMNENHIGGDINGGTLNFAQLLARPVSRLIPYKTPLPNVYLCSSSTPPGSGVHGMCGYYAAWFALRSHRIREMAIPATSGMATAR